MSKNIGKIIRANKLPEKGKRITNVIYQVAVPGTATYIDYAVDENGDIKTPTLNQSIAKNQFGKVKTVDNKEPDNNGNVDLGIQELKNNSEASMKKIGLQEVSNSFSLSSNLENSSEDKSVANFTFNEEEQNINLSVVDQLTALGGKLSLSKNGMRIEAPLSHESSGNPTFGVIEVSKDEGVIRVQRLDSNYEGFGFSIEEDRIAVYSGDGTVAEVNSLGIFEGGTKLISEIDLTEIITLKTGFFDLSKKRDLKKTVFIKNETPEGVPMKECYIPEPNYSRLGQEIIITNNGKNSFEEIKIKSGDKSYSVPVFTVITLKFDGETWIQIARGSIRD